MGPPETKPPKKICWISVFGVAQIVLILAFFAILAFATYKGSSEDEVGVSCSIELKIDSEQNSTNQINEATIE